MSDAAGVDADLDPDALRRKVDELGPWFHNLHLPSGVQTAPEHPLGDFPTVMWNEWGKHLPEDLSGWTVLDIGCNAGFYAFELARRGATVTAVDMDPRYLEQARWAARVYGLEKQVDFRHRMVYDLVDEPLYDLVIFLGVFYHLRYPLLGLDIVSRLARRRVVFQTLQMPGAPPAPPPADVRFDDVERLTQPGWPRMAFIEQQLAGDKTNWWVADEAAVEAMLRSTGLDIIERAPGGVYVCRPDQQGAIDTWDASEFLAATGRPWRSESTERLQPAPGTLESAAERAGG